MAYRKLKADTHPLTPELAEQFAAMMPLPGERLLKPGHVTYLTAQVLREKFSGPDWAVGTCLADGAVYRLDGQHSSHVLTHLPVGAEFPQNLLATITTYEFDSMNDAVDVFNLFNSPPSVRSNTDMMGIYGAHIEGLDGFRREFLVAVTNGIYEYEMQRKRKGAKDADLYSPRERGVYFFKPESVAQAQWLSAFRDTKNAHFLKKSVIVAEMIEHRVADAGLADTFWRLVFTEPALDSEHPARVVSEKFREMLAVASRTKIDPKVVRRYTRKGWRQFRTTDAQAA